MPELRGLRGTWCEINVTYSNHHFSYRNKKRRINIIREMRERQRGVGVREQSIFCNSHFMCTTSILIAYLELVQYEKYRINWK